MGDLGQKHTCNFCQARFYDLGKEAPTCPKCLRSLTSPPPPRVELVPGRHEKSSMKAPEEGDASESLASGIENLEELDDGRDAPALKGDIVQQADDVF